MTCRALELAARGAGQVSPSPLVGCVIVSGGGEIVGEGTYVYKNVTHAEVIALSAAGENARGATAYVSLEPHSHHGRTPPCTEALIEAGIKRVVCPVEDPNPLVSGKGFERLREAGVEVLSGLLRDEAAKLNEKFFCWHKNRRPFVHLKSAVSLDGKIATRTGDSKWITSEESRLKSQELRAEYDAILVGSGTVAADNPSLTDRTGRERHRPLVRVILDSNLSTDPTSAVLLRAEDHLTLFFGDKTAESRKATLEEKGAEVELIDGGPRDLNAVLSALYDRGITSVLVEGGSEVSAAFLGSGLVDKVTYFIAPVLIGGRQAPTAIGGEGPERLADAMRLRDVEVSRSGIDVVVTGYPA